MGNREIFHEKINMRGDCRDFALRNGSWVFPAAQPARWSSPQRSC